MKIIIIIISLFTLTISYSKKLEFNVNSKKLVLHIKQNNIDGLTLLQNKNGINFNIDNYPLDGGVPILKDAYITTIKQKSYLITLVSWDIKTAFKSGEFFQNYVYFIDDDNNLFLNNKISSRLESEGLDSGGKADVAYYKELYEAKYISKDEYEEEIKNLDNKPYIYPYKDKDKLLSFLNKNIADLKISNSDLEISFNKLYLFYIPNPEKNNYENTHFDYSNARKTNDYSEISSPERYKNYLKKYPMNLDRLERYYQIASVLNQVKLYKESNVLLIGIVNKYPKQKKPYLKLGDNYFALGQKGKAKAFYSTYIELEDKEKIPKRVNQRI